MGNWGKNYNKVLKLFNFKLSNFRRMKLNKSFKLVLTTGRNGFKLLVCSLNHIYIVCRSYSMQMLTMRVKLTQSEIFARMVKVRELQTNY